MYVFISQGVELLGHMVTDCVLNIFEEVLNYLPGWLPGSSFPLAMYVVPLLHVLASTNSGFLILAI